MTNNCISIYQKELKVETSFLELRCKQVINVIDGRLLGHIIDVIIDIRSSKILGLVVPGNKGILNIFKSSEEIYIPYCNICKIGQDTILVELNNLPMSKRERRSTRILAKEKPIEESAIDLKSFQSKSIVEEDEFVN